MVTRRKLVFAGKCFKLLSMCKKDIIHLYHGVNRLKGNHWYGWQSDAHLC